MGELVSTLKEASESIGVSLYKLQLESKIRSQSLYEIANNKKKMVNIEYITAILSTLNRLSKENGFDRTFDIGDIFKYRE